MDMRLRGRAQARSRCRVLIADDDEDTVASLDLLLTALGYDVRTARGGPEAIAVAAAFRPAAALLDLGMPGMDGCAVARWIRAQAWGQDTLLVAVTGWGQAQDYERTRSAGFDHHLLKPADPDLLAAMLVREKGRRPRFGPAPTGEPHG